MSYAKSVFFIPVWFDRFDNFVHKVSASDLWASSDPKSYTPNYLLHYAARIAKNETLFRMFSLKDSKNLNIYMYQPELSMTGTPKIQQVNLACFATGVGFLEFWVEYENMTPEEITDFAYQFKKTTKRSGRDLPDNQRALYDVACDLIPKDAALFFAAVAPFKYECNCFHFLHVDTDSVEQAEADRRLLYLCRSYDRKIGLAADSDYDMIYKPSDYDHWGGSSEGMVNITYDLQDPEQDWYLHGIKPMHLEIDYHFMYLLLLNQRFSAIGYIEKVSTALSLPPKEVEQLNRRIVELKTVFSFNVISDDRIFQNVYAKMYKLLEIEQLLADIVENEEQMDILHKSKAAKTDRMSSRFLFGISLLSLFSALIDASTYFDRFQNLQKVSTALGLVSVGMIVAICLAWLIRGRE